MNETEIVVADIGGTHARFALARIDGGTIALAQEHSLAMARHADLPSAWAAFAALVGRPLPRIASIAIAAPIDGDRVVMTNGAWRFSRSEAAATIGLDDLLLLNDFGAVAHAVEALGEEWLEPLCGPDGSLPSRGVISVLGPGTGLGVAMLVRTDGGTHVIETEGSHGDFGPSDAVEDAILAHLRRRYPRVSVERVLSGSGLAEIHRVLAPGAEVADNPALWRDALSGSDPASAAALARFCAILGSVAGDIALVQGARGVVIAGGLGRRLAGVLPASAFAARFVAKGRYEARMRTIPVRLITHPEPGLYGAAAAWRAARAQG